MADYKVTSPEGSLFAVRNTGRTFEEGDTVSLDLNPDTERAVVAAGWLDPVDKEN